MTSKLLVRFPLLLPRERTGATDTWTLGSLGWQVQGCVHSTAPGIGRVSFMAPFTLRALMENRGAASPTLLTLQFGHYRSQTGALAGTPRHLVLCRHRGRGSLF